MSKYLGLPELNEYVIGGYYDDSACGDGSNGDGDGDTAALGGNNMGIGSITMRDCSLAWTDGGEDSHKPLFEDVDAKKRKR